MAGDYLQVLFLTGEIKKNKKGFFKYINNKRKSRENVGVLLNKMGASIMEDTWKAVPKHLLPAVVIAKTDPQESQILETRDSAWRKEDFPLVEQGLVRDHLGKLDMYAPCAMIGCTSWR